MPQAPTAMVEFLREAVGVEGRELSEELALNSSELRLSEASLRPLLMELLSSQLEGQRQSQTPPAQPQLCPADPATCGISLLQAARAQTSVPSSTCCRVTAGSWHSVAKAGSSPAWHRLGALPAHKPP